MKREDRSCTEILQYKEMKWYQKIFLKITQILKKKEEKNTKNTLKTKKDENLEKMFLEKIKVDTNNEILYLQTKLKRNEIQISDLSDIQLEEMIKLYEEQIEKKKEKLKIYRKRFIQVDVEV